MNTARGSIRLGILSLLSVCIIVVLSAPIWVLWCPGTSSLRDHVYRTLMYYQLAQQVTDDSLSQDENIDRLAGYVSTHIWYPVGSTPYKGKQLDYLVKGVGWCDYQAKVLVSLLATRGIPARYAMLRKADGVSPHTLVEVNQRERWGLWDLTYAFRFQDEKGIPLDLVSLSDSPGLIDTQVALVGLREHFPDHAAGLDAVYRSVLPSQMSPRRSKVGTERLNLFDHLFLQYVRWGGQSFADWYQDCYLFVADKEWDQAALDLVRGRHYHLTGRLEEARRAYNQVIQFGEEKEAAQAQMWLGFAVWELDNDSTEALRIFQETLQKYPQSVWVPKVKYGMARILEELDRSNEAEGWYIEAVQGHFQPAMAQVVGQRKI